MAGANRAAGKAISRDWCGRSALYEARHALTTAWASSMLTNGSCTVSSSCCRVWCRRSILPVVVGERGLVSRWVMPFSRQIRSNSTSAGRGLPKRPVNCLPLSDSTSAGTPYSRIAATNAAHTARPVAR